MADKLRRTKDVLKKSLTSYLNSTTSGQYLTYYEGSPTYITFYQLDSKATLQDAGLETVNSLVGKNTPNKYKRIYEVPVYGVDALDVSNELAERGLLANVNGELMFLPDSVRPYPGDFFTFEYEGLEEHLFRITDVQYDRVSPHKYFRAQYQLWQDNVDNIFENIIGDYEVQYTTDGSGNSDGIEIVSKTDAAASEQIKNLTDGLIDKYITLYYDEDMDSFVFRDLNETDINGNNGWGDGIAYWSPYLQKFLHETKALTKNDDEILTEIYITDINEIDNGNVYSEAAYRNSIFRNIQIQNPDVTFDTNFLCISDYDLKCTRNLPFFMSPLKFKLVTPIIKRGPEDGFAYINSFPIFFENGNKLFKDVDHMHKVHVMDDIHIARIEPFIQNNDIIYECYRNELEPTKICMAIENTDPDIKEKYLEIQDISVERLVKTSVDTSSIENLELFNIIKDYLNGKFTASEDVINTLNGLYYKPNIVNYILMPLVIYILQDNIK